MIDRTPVSDVYAIAHSEKEQQLKIAVVCPGVGLVQRGFERLFYDLFQLMKDDYEVTLFKGGGARNKREKVLPFLHRNGFLVKMLPVHKLFGRTAMHTETVTFVMALLPHLIKGRYDIVHCIDPPLTRFLFKIRNLFGLKFRILYTEGCAMAPADYPPADHMQQISRVSYDEARKAGIPESYMTLLPCGIYPERFHVPKDRAELRRAYGIDETTFVILSVAALNRKHKRIDHLVDELTLLQGDFLVWMDGSLDHGDADLVPLAKKRLGDRCRITHVPSEKVGELYRLADVMVHCSIFEAFGLAIVEGASTGLPVITDHADHFQWLLQNPASWVDMRERGALCKRLAMLMADRNTLDSIRAGEETLARFSWHNLKEVYKKLYRHMTNVSLQNKNHCAGLK